MARLQGAEKFGLARDTPLSDEAIKALASGWQAECLVCRRTLTDHHNVWACLHPETGDTLTDDDAYDHFMAIRIGRVLYEGEKFGMARATKQTDISRTIKCKVCGRNVDHHLYDAAKGYGHLSCIDSVPPGVMGAKYPGQDSKTPGSFKRLTDEQAHSYYGHDTDAAVDTEAADAPEPEVIRDEAKFGLLPGQTIKASAGGADTRCKVCERPWREHSGWRCRKDANVAGNHVSDDEAHTIYRTKGDEPVTDAKMEAKIAKLVNEGKPVDIVREGRVITLPEGMKIEEGIAWLERRKADEQRKVAVNHQFEDVYALDALVALRNALSDLYNWVDDVPTMTFWGPQPPTLLNVRVGVGKVLSVPLGNFQVPGITGTLSTAIHPRNGHLVLGGEVLQGSMDKVREIALRAEHFIRTASIYRGQAIRVNWEYKRLQQPWDLMRDCPHFMDLRQASESDLVFSQEVAEALEYGLFTPIEFSQACRANFVPLKRGILLEGPYGTGKTLTALVTAIKAVRHKWTFVYLDSVLDLRDGLKLAQQYAPAIVFAEDIDRIITGDRTPELDMILNCLDGVDTKNHEIITVLTTNDVMAIHQAILRPGRLDNVVPVRPPDAEAAIALVRKYGRGLLDPRADLVALGEALAGKIPAVIREVVERAKIATIRRFGGADITGLVTGVDLLMAVKSMEAHADLLKPRPTGQTYTMGELIEKASVTLQPVASQ